MFDLSQQSSLRRHQSPARDASQPDAATNGQRFWFTRRQCLSRPILFKNLRPRPCPDQRPIVGHPCHHTSDTMAPWPFKKAKHNDEADLSWSNPKKRHQDMPRMNVDYALYRNDLPVGVNDVHLPDGWLWDMPAEELGSRSRSSLLGDAHYEYTPPRGRTPPPTSSPSLAAASPSFGQGGGSASRRVPAARTHRGGGHSKGTWGLLARRALQVEGLVVQLRELAIKRARAVTSSATPHSGPTPLAPASMAGWGHVVWESPPASPAPPAG
jgi:hypothetical protein